MRELTLHELIATACVMMVVSILAIILRFVLQWVRRDRIHREDALVAFAFTVFLVLAILSLVLAPIAYHIVDMQHDMIRQYDGISADEVFQLRTTFVCSLLFPTVLWSVKLSLMSISHRIVDKQPENVRRCWWALLGFVIVTFIGCLVVSFTRCSNFTDSFDPSSCKTTRDINAQLASFYFVVVVDIITDILIMIFPIIVLRKVQIKRSLYLRTSVIFSVGTLCIVTALCRGITLGVGMGLDMPTFPWLAFWGLVEGGIG
ncbi:hypothetical protein BGW36DRAFT_260390, partial [Talaromyces proteolyticus]